MKLFYVVMRLSILYGDEKKFNKLNYSKMEKIRKTGFCLSFILLVLIFSGYAGDVKSQNFDKAGLDSLLNYFYDNGKFQGTITISEGGENIYNKSFGLRDYYNNIPANTETKYRIGSISKTFTAVMILKLVEEGKISLTDFLSKYYPEIPNSDKITISHLMTHQSGIHNFTNSIDTSFYLYPKTRQEMIDKIKSFKTEFEPGEKTEYSNSNFVLLGYILENLTGKQYPQLLKEMICDKLGLKNTYYMKKTDVSDNEALSYSFEAGKWVLEPETDPTVPHGAGAIVSTTFDLTEFINALFDLKLISQKSLDEMLTIERGMGRGIFKMPFYETSGYGHTGGIDGFRSALVYFPDKKVSVAFTGNALNYSMNDILIGVLSKYFKRDYSFPKFSSVELKQEVLLKYAGVFSKKDFPIKITITIIDGKLTAQGTGQKSFEPNPVSDTEFTYEQAGLVMTFSEDGGQLTLKQGGETYIMTKEK